MSQSSKMQSYDCKMRPICGVCVLVHVSEGHLNEKGSHRNRIFCLSSGKLCAIAIFVHMLS